MVGGDDGDTADFGSPAELLEVSDAALRWGRGWETGDGTAGGLRQDFGQRNLGAGGEWRRDRS